MTSSQSAASAPPAKFLRSFRRVTMSRLDVLLASFCLNLLVLGLPLVILQVYDRILPSHSMDTFGFLIAGLCIIVLIDTVLRWVRSNIVTWSGARFEHSTLNRALGRLISTRIEDYERWPPGTHLDRLTGMEALREFHSGQGLIALSELPFVVLFLGLIWLIAGHVVFAPIAIVALAGLVAVFVGANLERSYRERAALDDERYNFAFQVLSGIHAVKGLGMEMQMVRQYQSRLAPLAGSVLKSAFFASLGQSLGTTLGNLAMVSVAAAGSLAVINGDLTGGGLLACTLLAGRAIQPLIRLAGIWVQSRNLKLASERLDEIMSLRQERHAPGDEVIVEGGFVLDNVTVHRGRVEFPVLKNISMEIRKGEIIALTGPVGSGKAAFLELLSGLIQPDEGRLLIDGRDSQEINISAYREEIGFARQEAMMFRGTILDNLTNHLGRDHLAPALEIATKLGLDDEIARMPRGLMTPVGDSASDALSASVQQTIALVRALAKNPSVFLFNEANSALDLDTDRRLRDLLIERRGHSTTILVTSRPSLISIADRAFEIRGGILTPVDMNGAGSGRS